VLEYLFLSFSARGFAVARGIHRRWFSNKHLYFRFLSFFFFCGGVLSFLLQFFVLIFSFKKVCCYDMIEVCFFLGCLFNWGYLV
jgi:hypothetical protein